MTMHVSLKYGGLTIDLMAGGYKVVDGYFPETTSNPDALITEQMNVLIRGSSHTDLQDKIRALDLALEHGRSHPSGPEGCYIHYAVDKSMEAWRSRLTNGVVMLDDQLDHRWRQHRALVQLAIERMPWWEAEDPVTLADAVALVNHEDAAAGHDFFISIAAADLDGGLPAPAIIEFKNTVNDARTVDTLFVGQFAASGGVTPPTETTLILEGAGTNDANCSGGSYAALSWTGTGINQLATWSLVTTFLGQRYFKLIARFQATFAYTDLWLQAKLLSGSLVLAETRWELMSATKELQLIGTLQIPPFRHGAYIDLGSLTVALYEKRAGGDGTINLDYIALMPQNGWRQFEAISGLAYNKTLIDDPVRDVLVTNYLTTYEVTHMVKSGTPIMLQPGVINLLYFLHDTDNGSAPIARTAAVTIKYHPRRRTL